MENIETKHWFTNKQVVGIIISVVVSTFYVTLVYAEFKSRSTQYEADKAIIMKHINTIEERLDKKIKIINENSKNINQLKSEK